MSISLILKEANCNRISSTVSKKKKTKASNTLGTPTHGLASTLRICTAVSIHLYYNYDQKKEKAWGGSSEDRRGIVWTTIADGGMLKWSS